MMKKLLLLTCITIIIMVINSKNNVTFAQPPLVTKTLNNIQQANAQSMITDFESKIYLKQNLPKLNFWFEIDVVKDIVQVIHDDYARQATSRHKVDGIRIYFTGDPTSAAGVSILLVTTVDSIDAMGRKMHHDYYSHAASEHLFANVGVAGSIYKPGQSGGAKLYQVSGNITDDGTCDFSAHPNYIPRSLAEEMVRGFSNDVVNTKAEWFPSSVFEEIANNPNCGGMRIYFATHPGTFVLDSPFVDGRDAFIITTTERGSNNDDFFDCRPPQISTQQRIIKPTKKKTGVKPVKKKHDLINSKKYKLKSIYKYFEAPDDNGELCPSHCN